MTDEELLADLRAMWSALDPVPDALVDDVLLRLAPELDDDAELLAVLDDQDLLAGVRAAGGTGSRTFRAPGLDLLLRVTPLDGDRRRIDGWVAPAGSGVVRVTVGAVRVTATVPATGRFELADLPAGAAVLDLTVREDGGIRRLRTPAFPL